ncbi:M20/M25/M40 family metallo-hydrolase [Acidaminobacter sp. JC074]|uniref:M20/M25/M40 family metallo-hydrolase n=1 Tax=Acidaminobacter sp. JC074 TaxID=2530199 RepID=UPI001F10D0ED|nr:M20/M25/M40 family metallo-hydrolase [Acidaminobacter sp. JC074]
MDISKVISERESDYIKTLKDLVAFPSVASDQEAVGQCRDYLVDYLSKRKWEVQVVTQEKGSDYVLAEMKSDYDHAPTVMIYGHYDVQPVEPISDWTYHPYDLTESKGRLYGRGAGDNKGQFLSHLLAIDLFNEFNDVLPVNYKLFLDGEEEVGSPGIEDMVNKNLSWFEDVDVVIVSDASKHESGRPTVCFGNRGCMSIGLSLRTAKKDHHSGNKGGVIKNSVNELCSVLSGLVKDNGLHIPGFMEGVVKPSELERQLIDDLDFDSNLLKDTFEARWVESDKETYFTNLFFKPVISVIGIEGGYMGHGIKCIVPGHAKARVDVRLVANQDPLKAYEAIKSYIGEVNDHVEISMLDQPMYPSKSDPENEWCQKIIGAVEKSGLGKPYVLPSIGGSLPNAMWTNTLKKPTVSLPFANADQGNHGPDENLKISCFKAGIQTAYSIIENMKREA